MAAPQTSATTTPVAIIGAGPCGLTFARLLQTKNIDYVVFENDSDASLTPLYQGVGEGRDAPEIDRFQLRQLLLESIPADRIHGGHGITPVKPEYSGKMFLEGRISYSNPSYTSVLELSGPGSMMALGQGRALMIQQVADRSYRVYMGLEGPEDLIRTSFDVGDIEATKEKLLSSEEFYRDFAPNLRQFIADAEGPFRPWILHRMPFSSLSWSRVPGVTLLGDAAHVSTPFVGEGVNMAMHDALKLAQSIEKHCCGPKCNLFEDSDKIEQPLKEYETEMFDRAQDFIRRCMLSEDMFFADNGAQLFMTPSLMLLKK
ncbi:uncharacterized protein GLRG_08008 [Colletotrichum graminicola M1.001]|uniref:FAD-binding domain-containing protein n=1 Tax=Colletotrichum graminicola (strain M1.001 / M2 / FGSC 10212) TaxID=645133 RepID=E3QPT7_COLGM|nr:uncharacterized protein GLRG_08008 [Colletotrichum graminicola M1.001]EFQ32864.1 hypothetical protein GLRG_08008 [Colletotrichum graminicola M1.001]